MMVKTDEMANNDGGCWELAFGLIVTHRMFLVFATTMIGYCILLAM
jgi:hypothetical protein